MKLDELLRAINDLETRNLDYLEEIDELYCDGGAAGCGCASSCGGGSMQQCGVRG